MMSDPAPIEVVRSRFSSTPDQDEAALQAYADHLEHLRRRFRAEEVHGTEIAMTFDPRTQERPDA